MYALERGSHKNARLQEDYNTYGKDEFAYSILEECSVEEIVEVEDRWIQELCEKDYDYNLMLRSGNTTQCFGERADKDSLYELGKLAYTIALDTDTPDANTALLSAATELGMEEADVLEVKHSTRSPSSEIYKHHVGHPVQDLIASTLKTSPSCLKGSITLNQLLGRLLDFKETCLVAQSYKDNEHILEYLSDRGIRDAVCLKSLAEDGDVILDVELSRMSMREKVLHLRGLGWKQKDIAEKLGRSVSTVKRHGR